MKNSFAARACCLLLFTLAGLMGKAQLKANFTATPVNGCAPLLVNFTDGSTGNPTQWKWDLGNGTISFLQNPSVSYFNPGYYTIKLVVKNASGADSVAKTQFINVAAKPVVQFSAATTTGCFPLPVKFTDQSTAATDIITTWQWDFGDGFSSGLQNPLHVYSTAGNYNVTLRVINNKGCLNTLSKSQFVKISSGAKADFSTSMPKVCSTPVTINFTNTSVGTGTLNYQWLFGDGGSSALTNPSHVYTTAGSYSVTLFVTNAGGCKDTIVKTNAVTAGNVFPGFTASDTVCKGSPVIISDTSKPAASSVSWSFGDGTFSTLPSPVKIYTAAGNYKIKLTANFGSCLDSAFKTIVVLPAPTAAFIADDSTNCSNPFTVNFTNQSVSGATYRWDFGDGTTSATANPAHTYNSYGSFTVKLVAVSANGCTDSLVKASYIKIIKPVVSFNNLPDSGCVSFTKYFTSATTSVDAVTGYLWDFGDGATSTNATPTHTYTTAGVYTVTLIINTAGGCSDTVTMANGIVTQARPVAKFSATPTNTCAKTDVVFTDNSTGNIIKWLWLFGDGSIATSQNPKHVYGDTGVFDVKLIVWNSGCPDTANYISFVHISPPIGRFTESIDCSKPLERLFTDQSVGADEWSWNFGDGNTSTQQSPVHTYALPGTYNVMLTVKNILSGCDFTIAKTIQVVSVKPNFYASDTVICKGSNLTFTTGLSLTDVQSLDWDFGDGKTANLTTATTAKHLYTAAGNYTVRLIITNILGCKDTLTKPAYIRIDGPTAAFIPSVPGSCLNSLITFNDASVSDNTHPIQTWSWNYGDSTTQVLPAPPFQHNYTMPGAYNVTLKVTDSKGCTDSVNIATPLIISKPVALFTPLDSVSCPTQNVGFSNQSTGPGLNYLWDFGDGTTSDAQTPVHNYLANGVYSVKLSIIDQYGCTDSVSKPNIITIVTPAASFTMSDSFSICPPLIVQFANSSVHAIAQTWDFGDGTSAAIAQPSHFYSYPGIYTVTLTITGKGGCTDVMKKNIVVRGPTGTFTYNPISGCNPVTVNFVANTQDRVSFIWDYNDGATVSTKDSVISHTYTNPGIYLPKMILFDANGCQVPITGKDTIHVNGITAKFGFQTQQLCDKGSVSFLDSTISNDIVTGYKWSFGDGGTSTLKDPQHQYASTGLYYPKLTVTTLNGCIDSVTSAKPVKVAASPQINIASTANGCTPLSVTFNGKVAVADTSKLTWLWTFGNGDTSTMQNPPVQKYNLSGVYNNQLIATNSSGCKDTATKAIDAWIIPSVNAGPDTTICNRAGVVLKATGASTYNWSPATGLSCVNCASPTAMPDSARNYILKGTSVQGCSASDTVLVKVQYALKMKYSNPDTLCKGQNVKLFATGTDNYQWSPPTGLNDANIALPVAKPDTNITYRVIGTDYLGCFKDTGYVAIRVFPLPTVNAGADKTINSGQSLDLVPVLSPDVTVVTWTPTGSIFRNTYPVVSVKPPQTTNYTVEVKNNGGCMARDVVTVHVLCNGANVFIPNTFSPNADGANDVFYPRGTGLFKIKTLRIFNRWGQVVFEKQSFNANDALSGWDGTFKGAKLSADVFVYMIDIICDNNSVLTYKGNVALIQ